MFKKKEKLRSWLKIVGIYPPNPCDLRRSDAPCLPDSTVEDLHLIGWLTRHGCWIQGSFPERIGKVCPVRRERVLAFI